MKHFIRKVNRLALGFVMLRPRPGLQNAILRQVIETHRPFLRRENRPELAVAHVVAQKAALFVAHVFVHIDAHGHQTVKRLAHSSDRFSVSQVRAQIALLIYRA